MLTTSEIQTQGWDLRRGPTRRTRSKTLPRRRPAVDRLLRREGKPLSTEILTPLWVKLDPAARLERGMERLVTVERVACRQDKRVKDSTVELAAESTGSISVKLSHLGSAQSRRVRSLPRRPGRPRTGLSGYSISRRPLHRGVRAAILSRPRGGDQAQRVGDLVESAVTRRRSCVGRRTRSPRPPAQPAPSAQPAHGPNPHRHRTRTHRPYPAASHPTAFLATATRSRRCRHRPPSAELRAEVRNPIEDRRPVTSHLLAPSERSIGMGGLLALVVVMKASKKHLEVVRVERRIEALHDNAQTAPSVRGHGRGLDRRRPAWRLLRGATQGTAPADRAPRATRDFALPAPRAPSLRRDVSMIGLDPLAPETARTAQSGVDQSCAIVPDPVASFTSSV